MFFLINLESRNQAKNIPDGLPSFQSKFEANRSRGSWVMIGQTNRQTEITTLYINLWTIFDRIVLFYIMSFFFFDILFFIILYLHPSSFFFDANFLFII